MWQRSTPRPSVVTRKRWVEILVLTFLVSVFIARGFVPGWRTLNTDFPNYYLTARLYRQGVSLARVYDWIWFQRQKDHAGIEKRIVTFWPLTLHSAMPIIPLASLSPLSAKRAWLVINLVLLGCSGLLLRRMTVLGGMRVAILAFLAIQPLQAHFLYGQLHILVLFLLVLSLWLYLTDRPIASGGLVAFAAAIKIYPILLLFYFLRKKQWRVIAGMAGGVIVAGALGISLFGVELNRVYLEQVLPRVIAGDTVDPYSIGLNSFAAFFHRLFIFEPELNPDPLVDFPAAYALLYALTQGLVFFALFWLLSPSRVSTAREKLEYASYVAILLLLSTNQSPYLYTALILVAVLTTDFLLRNHRILQAVLFLIFYTVAGLPWFGSLPFSRLFATLLLFILLLHVLRSTASAIPREQVHSHSMPLFGALSFLVIVSFSFFNFRHLRNDIRDYTARIALEPGSLMKTHPAVSGNRVAFTKLQSSAYGIGVFDGGRVSSFVTETDLFHPALVPNSPEALVEMAGPTSRIVRLDVDGDPASPSNFRVEVEDGQQPVVSPDGQWLGFIREDHGRGSFWLKPLQAGSRHERELVGPEYDVLEAAFDQETSEIVFSAQPDGRPALFKVGRASPAITQLTFGVATRYPAFSPDSQWMAYCKLARGSWQIWIKPSRSGSEHQLTYGDCNSTSPAWMSDSRDLVYAADCGRGANMTGLARIRAVP